MNRRKKGGNSSVKPPALSKPGAPSSSTPAPPSAIPARVSPPPKTPAPPQNVAPPQKAVPQPARTAAQAPRPTASPPKPPAPGMSAMKTAAPAARPGPSQRREITRSDRVRAQWMDFEVSWVRQRQAEVAQQLTVLLKAAEKNSRVKGRALEQNQDRIVNTVRREFAMAARAEWEARLEKAGLQAEDWTDMTPEEMFAVEQVLSCEDEDADPGVYALAQQRASAASTLSGKTAVESSPPPPLASQSANGRTSQAPPPAAAQKTSNAGPQAQAQSSSWIGWAASAFTRGGVSVKEVPEEPSVPKPNSSWAAKNAPIIEDLRSSPQTAPTPQAPPQARPAQPAPQTAPPAPAHGLLAYAVPISLTMAALDATASQDAEFSALVDKLYVNSIRQFHMKASEADADLARQLRKPMPPGEREWTVRAHMMMMEQMARDIVERRDTLVSEEKRKRGFGDGSGGDPTPMTTMQTITQPPGAFPEEPIRVSPVPEPEEEPEPEPEREPEPDVDEEIVILPKSKGKKKGKKAAEVKTAANGRSTPTLAPATKTATPVAKAAPAVEKKPAPAVSAWAAKAAVPVRSASPAPINTKVAPASAVNGRSTPAPVAMSPWEAAQAAKASNSSSSKAPETKPPSPPNGIWAPPMARATSSKNPYAPARPSRLANVTEPASPEPPSPPPTREPTGKDYLAWFAGSSSEDEGGAEDAGLSEDEDEDDDEDDGPGPSSSFGGGGLLSSLSGGSPWALFGESQQPQKERGRTASPARGRGATATPTPAMMATGGRYGAEMGMGMGMGMGGEWARWGSGGPSPPTFGAGPSGYGAPPLGPRYGAGPSAMGQWPSQSAEEDLENMLSNAVDRTANGKRGAGGVGIEEMMGMYVAAQKARETLATPVGGRSASAWRR